MLAGVSQTSSPPSSRRGYVTEIANKSHEKSLQPKSH